jgi:ribosomal-protein-serine acetyltransferase
MKTFHINSKILLEPLDISMSDVIFETIDRDREYLGKWLPFVNETRLVSDTEAFIKSITSQTGKKKDIVYSIWYKLEFAGLIGFKDTDWINHKTEIGYWLAEKMQGKGIITLCVKELIHYAFTKLNMNRVQIKSATGNKKSAAIPTRLGFQFEGTERQGEFCQNRFFDLDIFSFLKSDQFKNS